MALKQLSDGNTDGTSLGQSASDLISFYGVTPVAQAATFTSVATTAAASANTSTVYGYSSTQANAIVTAVNAIITCLENVGLAASS